MDSTAKIILIVGGIGAGKSAVMKLISTCGKPTYDCDARAKTLVNTDPGLRREIVALLGEQAYSDGVYDTRWVAKRIFADSQLRDRLNGIVHPAVISDIGAVARKTGGILFIETALPKQSGLDLHAHQVWRVTAPDDVRVARVMARNNVPANEVLKRIQAQRPYESPIEGEKQIINDGIHAIIPQVYRLMDGIYEK